MSDILGILKDRAFAYRYAGNPYYANSLDEAAAEITRLLDELAKAREAMQAAIGTLAASRHLMGKYCPDHQWMPEHDRRIAELKAALAGEKP